jgi:O-antigen/teichoic acid export membrane protein
MSQLKILAGETALYGLGSMLPRMLNFFLVTLHTNIFSLAEYGAVTKLYAFVAFVNIVFMFGMETAFFRFANKPNADAKKIFNLAQTCVVLISLPLTILVVLFSSPIASYMEVAARPEFITWLALVMLTDALVAIPFARLRLEKKAFQFAAAKVVNVLILLGLNFYFLKINYDPTINVGYVLLANLLANSFFILFFLKTLIAWRPAFDQKISPAMLHYAYPVMLTGVAGTTNEMFSRLSLDWWLPPDFYRPISNQAAVGVFGACYKFAVLMNLGIQAFRYAAEPFFFSQAADKKAPALFARVNHYFVIAGCLVFLAISINLDLFQLLIGTDFRSGMSIVPILLMAYLLLGIYYNFSVWFKLTDKTYYGTFITIAGAAITIAANFLLVPIMGYTGSSWATLFCYGFMVVACYWLGQKYFPIPYRVWASLSYLICTVLIVYGVQAVNFESQWMATTFHLFVVICFMVCIYFFERKTSASAIGR